MIRTVLVVSQDPAIRCALKELRGPELRLVETATGLGALFLCAFEAVDLLVVDPAAAGMQWPGLLEKVTFAFPQMPVLSAEAGEEAAALRQRIREALASAVRRKQPGPARNAGEAFGEERSA
jgi:CheY-like chemotaxis protein